MYKVVAIPWKRKVTYVVTLRAIQLVFFLTTTFADKDGWILPCTSLSLPLSVSWTSWSTALLLRPTNDAPRGVGIADQAPRHIQRWEVRACSFPSLSRGRLPTSFWQRRHPQSTIVHIPSFPGMTPYHLYTVVSRNCIPALEERWTLGLNTWVHSVGVSPEGSAHLSIYTCPFCSG